jgi:hypothetical protein
MNKRGLIKVGFSLTLLLTAFQPINLHAQQRCDNELAASTPDSEFMLNADNTIVHRRTGLMWQRCVHGLSGEDCNQGGASLVDWEGALVLASSDQFAGYADWRLPNVKELASLIEDTCFDPSINTFVFPNTPADFTWTSSIYVARFSAGAWVVNFFSGGGTSIAERQGAAHPLRLVRDNNR